MNTLSPLTELKGIGEKTEKLFAKVGVTNVGELLSYYPRTYETYGEIQKPDAVTDGMTAALYGQFQGPLAVKRVKNMQIVSGVFESDARKIRITWYNMPYLIKDRKTGVPYMLIGQSSKEKQTVGIGAASCFFLRGISQDAAAFKTGVSSDGRTLCKDHREKQCGRH